MMRKVEKAAEEGNAQAALAIDAFCDNITGYIGMFAAYMGGLDAMVHRRNRRTQRPRQKESC